MIPWSLHALEQKTCFISLVMFRSIGLTKAFLQRAKKDSDNFLPFVLLQDLKQEILKN